MYNVKLNDRQLEQLNNLTRFQSLYPADTTEDLQQQISVAWDNEWNQGFEDGQRSTMRSNSTGAYKAGFAAGLKQYRCTVPATVEQPLERGWGEELLNPVAG